MVRPDGTYEIGDVELGRYVFEVIKLPKGPLTPSAVKKWDRTPAYRAEITVEGRDLEHSIEIR